MKIDINDKWQIRSDERQYILGEKYIREVDGEEKEYLRNTTYYNTLEQLLQGYVQKRIRTKEDITEFQQVVEKLKELKAEIKEIKTKLDI